MSINESIKILSPQKAFEMSPKEAVIVDIREKKFTAYKQLGTENVVYCPFPGFADNSSSLPTDKLLILCDTSGIYSREAAEILRNKGFANIAILSGGVVEWERDGLPLNEEIRERLSGSCVCMLRPRNK